ncbi:hypothetical protein [Geofilum rubicundum]|uniref:Uncharacterized protein n=1 Tax=Geofilum rubicundum JCM 15548 TaxID=1236989 RepID=A0A0E9M076_9BACT|nr:hypothetical protein [Geofilum rubicundum]GAO30520.1 hypothetical protein JCM15548_12799 [Geofilum rubicundum JCM 15548]
MNPKQLFTTFAIAIIGAFIGVLTFTVFIDNEPRTVEVPVQVEHAARYANLPLHRRGGCPT